MSEHFKTKPNLRKRIFATILDYVLYFLFVIVYIYFFGVDDGKGEFEVSGIKGFPVIIVWFIYFVLIEGLYGGTLGHQAFYLEVMTLKGKPISLKHALKRRLLDLIDIFFYGIVAIIVIKNTKYHQRVGDLWAQTIVVDLDADEQYADESAVDET